MKRRKRWALPPSPPAARDRRLKRSSFSRKQKKCLFATRTKSGRHFIDLYEALVLFTEGRLFEARRLCASAQRFFSTSPMRGKTVLAELLLARIAMRLADNGLAKQHCLAALKDLENLDSPTLLYQSEFLLGEVERATGNEDAAYDSYCRARAAVERLRSSLRGEELKIAFFENKLEVYESLVDICLRRQNSFEEAFAYIEQAKSRTLMDLLNQPVHVASAADPGQSELVRSIRNLREELNWYYNLIEREQLRPEERSQERVQQLERQARSRESRLDAGDERSDCCGSK